MRAGGNRMSDLQMSQPVGRKRSAGELGRRLVHGAVALGLLVLLAPVLLLLALLVRASSPGPVFFGQQRVGQGGRLFRIYKFRTMRVNNSGPQVTAGADPRITPIGARLRHWKLDELPQLLNVLKGDMAFVGPRPEVPCYVAYYTPEQRQVLSVPPGITGLTQLRYRNEEELMRGAPDPEALYLREIMPQKLALDLEYVRRRNAWMDLCLTAQTFTRILG
jgi:lipopolysaccharide/colanic/teichoic acid biosynthesis glycosyltransferase